MAEISYSTVMADDGRKIWRDGELIRYEAATIHVLSHAAHRGSEVFDVLRIERTSRGTCAVGLREHVARFMTSMDLMGMKPEASIADLEAAVSEVVSANEGTVTVKLVGSWTDEANGTLPLTYRPTLFVAPVVGDHINAEKLPLDPIRVQTAAGPKIPRDVLPPGLKVAASYVPGIRHQIRASQEGFDEILFTSSTGDLAESTSLSCFVGQGSKLVVPPLDGVLDSITRRMLLEIANEANITVEVRPVAWDEVCAADELFLSSTNNIVRPIAALDDKHFDAPGAISTRLSELAEQVLEDNHRLSRRWLTPI